MRSVNVQGMYIGSTDEIACITWSGEIVDNGVDEALSGFGSQIDVTINKMVPLSVEDQGRGMPTGMHAMGKPTVEVIFTVPPRRRKFGQGGAIDIWEVFMEWDLLSSMPFLAG